MFGYSCMYVFFFKQKTAYEMRISDWSSDVFSSDLSRGALEAKVSVIAIGAVAAIGPVLTIRSVLPVGAISPVRAAEPGPDIVRWHRALFGNGAAIGEANIAALARLARGEVGRAVGAVGEGDPCV